MAAEVIGDVKVISFKLQWEIDVFRTLALCQNVGEFVKSPNFMASSVISRGVQWHLKLGFKQSSKDYLSLFLYVNKEIKAFYNVTLINTEGKVIVNKRSQERVFDKRGWGYEKFLSRNFMINPLNNVLNGDKMTIVCKVTVPARCEEKEVKLNNEVENRLSSESSEVMDKFEDLLNNSKFSDVSLVSSEGKALKVHKCILVKSSSVFAAMFEAEMRERQENTVEIADIQYDVLREMIRFIYSKKVNNIDALAYELAVAADKYALDKLKNTCEKNMRKNLSLDNVVACLQLADRLRMDKLKKKSIEFVVENLSDITDNPDFHFLSADILREICYGLAKKKTNN